MKKSRFFFLFFIFCLYPPAMQGQMATGTLQGHVTDYNNDQPLAAVVITIEGSKLSAHTDEKGFFRITGVPEGKYNLMCLKTGCYCTMSDPVEVQAGKVLEVELKMLPGDPSKFLYISIGGITVTAERDLIPENHETVHKISAGEIEHMQATNLGDILDLIPGVERKNRPGLEKKSFIGLRGVETDRSYDTPDVFGTKIIVDEIPMSNNTNLNSGTGVGYGSNVTTNVGQGIDLRGIVADNIQKVEVVSGVPSVEYGDLTTGIVKVTTQSGNRPMRLKMKNNPDTREFNVNGGNPLFSNLDMFYNLNYAHSERDIRQDGDEVSRVSGQLNLDYISKPSGLTWKNRIFYTQLFEDYYLKDDPRATRAYGKDYSLNLGTNIEKKLRAMSKIGLVSYFNYTRRKNFTRKFQVIDPSYLSPMMTGGTQEGILITDPYFWEVNTTGEEIAVGFKLKMEQGLLLGKMLHKFLYGIDYSYEDNLGRGKQFDPLKPPYGSGGNRPRSFDEVPGFTQLSLFLEDRITGKFVMPYTLSLGVRGEMYNPEKIGGSKLIESQNGTFWNPRIGFQLKPVKKFQVRGSYGITSKAPSLDAVYPSPVYYDILEWGRDPADPNGLDSIPLITTYYYPLTNEDLKGYTQEKYELGVDYQFGNLGVSLTGYRQRTEGTIVSVDLPYIDRRYRWPNWPSDEGKVLVSEQDIILRNYQRKENSGWNTREGVELSVRTHRLPRLNMIFRVSGSYNFKRHGYEDNLDIDSPRSFTEYTTTGDTIDHYAYPMFPYTSGWRKNLIMNYSLDYVNRTLGIWVTLSMYHKIYEKRKNTDLADLNIYATGYYEDGNFTYISADQAALLGLTNKADEGDIIEYRNPSSYYFNLTVSKNIWQGMEVSLFVNNFMNYRGFYVDQYGFNRIANPEIFYGIEFSMMVDPLTQRLKNRLF